MSREKSKYDFMAMDQAIKEARLKRGWMREKVLDIYHDFTEELLLRVLRKRRLKK